MNRQQMFDKVASHLLAQNKKSFAKKGFPAPIIGCAYRGENGLKCAIGCLIPDDLYVPGMEGRNVYRVLHHYPELTEFIPDLPLAACLQDIHDRHLPERWKDYLREVAIEFNLSDDILKEFT